MKHIEVNVDMCMCYQGVKSMYNGLQNVKHLS